MPTTKLAAPEPPPYLVSRPRLLSTLDTSAERPVTVVSAPAGFGKTLLLADWLAHGNHHGRAVWVVVDGYDNDERYFWSALLDALSAHPAMTQGAALTALAVPESPSEDPAFLASVVDILDEQREPMVLVLDDLDELTEPGPWHGLHQLVRHRPAGLRLVLSGRRAPPLSLARFRLADELTELRADDLRFTAAEAEAMFAASGVTVPPSLLDRVTEASQGWAVGLRLAAEAAGRDDGIERFLAGQDRTLQEYLADEVLSPLPVSTREFLQAISVCRSLTPELARALSGREDAAALLRELSEQAMLLSPAAEGESRLSPLVRSYLLADLVRRDPARLSRLHLLASNHFAGQDRPVGALVQAVRAGEQARIAELLARYAARLFVSGAHQVLRYALDALDDPTVDPLFTLVLAALNLERGESAAADLQLGRVHARWPLRPPAVLTVLRDVTLARRAQLSRDQHELTQAGARIDLTLAEDTGLELLAAVQRESALLSEQALPQARRRIGAVLVSARRQGQDHVTTRCLTTLGQIAERCGDYRAMAGFARAVADRNRAPGRRGTVDGAATSVLLAYHAFLRADLPACIELVPGDGSARQPGAGPAAAVLAGAAEFELGRWRSGLRRMDEVRASLTGRAPAEDVALCAVLEQRAALLLGAGERAREVLHWAQEMGVERAELLLLRARAQLALGRNDLAATMAGSLFEGDVPATLSWTAIEAAVVAVVAMLGTGERARAHRMLAQALSWSEGSGVWFPLVCAPAQVADELTAQLGRLGKRDRFTVRLLQRRRSLDPPPLPAPLTDREQSVLRLLPTLRSIDEIAEDLTVSPNTVKTHVRGIYAKLSVRRRRDAVAVAMRRGLLDAENGDSTG
ncbi:LuxR C-terminal-related transcriptional regulator [Amycolatopsis sp. GM8]|uniref:LuxR C-terminal-related transcriptional regulator n=1 Tax=Amycolatopsis sp. GM8 TaxID=2896530 RepID=UPI001F01EFAC|nr:LuxR C-terminal-related transcriptional regulator [Amycolatopsis sp. GM8]